MPGCRAQNGETTLRCCLRKCMRSHAGGFVEANHAGTLHLNVCVPNTVESPLVYGAGHMTLVVLDTLESTATERKLNRRGLRAIARTPLLLGATVLT